MEVRGEIHNLAALRTVQETLYPWNKRMFKPHTPSRYSRKDKNPKIDSPLQEIKKIPRLSSP